MKKILFISLKISLSFLIVFSALRISGQTKMPTGSSSEIRKFKETSTYIVKEDKLISEFNLAIEKAAKTHWDITDYKIISSQEFNNMRKNPDASFVYLNPVYFEKDKTQTAYLYMFLSLGHSSGSVRKMPDLCAIPLGIKGTDQKDYVYKLGLVLEFMQNHIEVSSKNPGLSGEDMIDYYTSQEYDLADFELWLQKNEMESSIKNITSIKKEYPYPVKFVSQEDIAKAIKNRRKGILILHLIKAGENKYCLKLIIDTHHAYLFYYDYHKTNSRKPSALLEKDLKKIAK